MHQTSNKRQCYQQPNYSDLSIKTALTKNQDPTGQRQELCVKNQLLKYQLDPMVNEVGSFILRKVCSVVNN